MASKHGLSQDSKKDKIDLNIQTSLSAGTNTISPSVFSCYCTLSGPGEELSWYQKWQSFISNDVDKT